MKKKVIRLRDEAAYFRKSMEKILKNKEAREAYEAEGLRQEIAMQIHEVRIKKHLTQKQLAKLLSMPQQQVSRIETGEQNITMDMLAKIAAGLKAKVKVRIAV